VADAGRDGTARPRARPPLRRRPRRGPGRPRPLPRPRRADRRPDPRARRRARAPRDPARRGRPRRHRRRPRPGDARARRAAPSRRPRRRRRVDSSRPTCSTLDCRGRAVRLAFIALNTLFLLATATASGRRSRPRRAPRPGGLAVVDVWLPEHDDLARFDGRLISSTSGRSRDRAQVTKVAAARHDADRGSST
jgi:hypothetical protein